MQQSLQARIAARVGTLRDARLLRTLRSPRGIDLCSNDYLALSQHPLIKQAFIEGVSREGCGSTGSRLLRGERDSFADVERTFARWKQTARALYFSSGYLANIAVLTTFAEEGDVIFSDERNHASLIDGARLSRAKRVVFPHHDVASLARLIEEHGTGQPFVVTESLFSMDGDFAPLTDYAEVCRSHGAALIVDEAHAVGIYGARGSGRLEASGVDADDVLVSVNSAGKGLGVAGAFVAGSAWAIEYLVQRARPFIFSTAAPPALTSAIATSLAIVQAEPDRREHLARLSRDIRARLLAARVSVAAGSSQIVPVLLGDNERATAVADVLQAQGFDARAIRPPTVPAGTARLRIAVNVGLDADSIERFVSALAAAVHESTRCTAASS